MKDRAAIFGVRPAMRLGPMISLALVVSWSSPLAAAEALKDWPCKDPLVAPLTATMVWPGGLPDTLASSLPAERAWEADPLVRDAVEFMASPENSAAASEDTVARLAREPGRDRRATLLLAFSGVVDLSNRLRAIMVDGIGVNVVRSKVIAEVVDDNSAALRQAADDADRAAAIRQARFWNLRRLDKTEDDAGMLCRRITYSERKLRSLAALIQKAMD